MSSWREAEGMVYLREGEPLRPIVLRNAVKQAGFTPTWIELRAAGILMKKNSSLILHIGEIPQEFILIGDKTREIVKFISKKIVVTGNVQEEKAHVIIFVKKYELF